jgi:hypothetical protein
MRTSAQKNFSLWARIEKEISREIDRALRARNFTPIARSRASALEAIERDRIFSRRRANRAPLSSAREFFFVIAKIFFSFTGFVRNRDDITQKIR